MIGLWDRSMWLTYAGGAIAVAGIVFAAHADLRLALICLILAGLADLFDGPVARRLRSRTTPSWEPGEHHLDRQSAYGLQLDSLVDVLSFLALPVVIVTFQLMAAGTPTAWWQVAVLAGYAIAGVARLAWFNATTEATPPATHYRGLPVTYAALILPLLSFARIGLAPSVFAGLVMAEMIVLAVLFLVDVRVPKPRGAAYLGLALLALGTLAALFWMES